MKDKVKIKRLYRTAAQRKKTYIGIAASAAQISIKRNHPVPALRVVMDMIVKNT